MTDAERLRYLQLKKKKAMAASTATPSSPALKNKAQIVDVLAQSLSEAYLPAKLIPSAEKTFTGSSLPIVGGAIGGIAGGGPISGGAGAALGGAAGESIRQLGSRALGLPTPATAGQSAGKIAVEGATQGLGEAIGAPVLRGVGKAMGAVVKKPIGQMFQVLTKLKPDDAATLFKNPEAILPWEWTKAQKAWREAAKEIGIPIDDVSPEMIDILRGDAKAMVFDTYKRLQAGEAVTAKEAQLAKQAIDIAVMPVAKTVRKNPLVSTLNQIRQEFQKRIGKESPKMAKANRDYAVAATGRKFRTLLPQNRDQSPAVVRSIMQGLPIVGGAYGAGADGDSRFWGGVGGALKGAAITTALSPAAIGTGIALTGGVSGLAPFARRVVTGSLAELLKDELSGQ